MSRQIISQRREAVINPHPDPITGETGSHPIAVGVGAGVVGTLGMLVGLTTGPVGAIAGIAIGSILGGLVGKSAAEATHPTIEDYDARVVDFNDTPARIDARRRIQPVTNRPTIVPMKATPIHSTQTADHTADQSIVYAALRGRNFLAANEERYWQQHYGEQPYYRSGLTYRDYQPAYRLGYEGYARYHGTGISYDEVEPELQRQYEQERQSSWLTWEQARPAVRDGWYRVEQAFRGR